ncbi:MAG: biotin transporter BioY [Candidatus Aegiribacteria sp.]|nr:biotin transporter BioY [Candidatus Aegiribacteria sp.]
MLLIAFGTFVIALCARLEIPAYPVPITGQTFGILLIAALLGSRRGVLCVMGYLSLGAIGLPVFAGCATGLTAFAGPTAGYIVGFAFAAFTVGSLCEKGWDRSVSTTILAMLAGSVAIYVPGVVWLSRFVGWDRVIDAGVIPFIIGDTAKIAAAAILFPSAWRFVNGRRREDY